MRKTVIILSVLAAILSGCKQTVEKQDKISSAENAVSPKSKEESVENENFGNKQNPLYGKVFRETEDIPVLRQWDNGGGGRVIDTGKDKNGGYRFGIDYLKDDKENMVCIFEEFVQSEDQGKVNYKILDTINIGKLKDNEAFSFSGCRQDTMLDSEIIAVAIAEEDKEYHDKIVKAWRADTKTGRIEPIKNIKGITCVNMEYGAF